MSSTPSAQTTNTTFYGSAPQIGSRDKSVEWYGETVSIPADSKSLLETYSSIPPEAIEDHMLEIRDKAWEIWPYPCVGQFRFIALRLYRQPSYPHIVDSLKRGAKYLDIGCCLGQDIRKLVVDGVPSENLYGAEIQAGFIDVGYDLFKDRETLKAHFMQADALELGEGSTLQELSGAVDYIHLGMVLHVFGLKKQMLLLENCVKLLKPEPGALILGTVIGDVEGMEGKLKNFLHSDKTFENMWGDISNRTGLRFECRIELGKSLGTEATKMDCDADRTRLLTFEVKRL